MRSMERGKREVDGEWRIFPVSSWAAMEPEGKGVDGLGEKAGKTGRF